MKLFTPPGSTLQVKESPLGKRSGSFLLEDDWLCNFTTEKNQLMRPDGVPWRGAREKDPRFMQIWIESLTSEGDVVVDFSASTGRLAFIAIPDHCSLSYCCNYYTLYFYILLTYTCSLVGSSIIVCRRSGRHIIAFEDDAPIFDGILAPMRDDTPDPPTVLPTPTRATSSSVHRRGEKRTRSFLPPSCA